MKDTPLLLWFRRLRSDEPPRRTASSEYTFRWGSGPRPWLSAESEPTLARAVDHWAQNQRAGEGTIVRITTVIEEIDLSEIEE